MAGIRKETGRIISGASDDIGLAQTRRPALRKKKEEIIVI